MFRRTFLSALLFTALIYKPAPAEDYSTHLGLFANAKEVFRPLLADPREIQVSLRWTTPISNTSVGDVAAGDYFGLYRWALPWRDSYLQWSLAGGIFSRFDLVSMQKDNEVIDYYAQMPLDARVGKWSLRLVPQHISSHLGDDYIKRTGTVPQKHAIDDFKSLLAYEPERHVRLYAGGLYIMRNTQVDMGRYAVQAGAEWTSDWWAGGHAQLYLAHDFQSWSLVEWNPDNNTQLGVRLAKRPEEKQMMAIFTEYGTGHIRYLQFIEQKETHWVIGIKFYIS